MAAHGVEDSDNNNRNDSKHSQTDNGCLDYVAQLVEREIGGDIKSLKKVLTLLEKLTAENKVLEEQVSI